MAHPKHEAVRTRYGYRCGYCGVSEVATGGELTVDHFHPESAGGDDSDDNLVYACVRCNLYKGALLPEATEPTLERRLLHPLKDDLAAHIRENEMTGRLEAITATGVFHIAALRLNRSALIANRQQRNLIALLEERLDQAVAENTILREGLIRRDIYVAYLETRLQSLDASRETE